jgi:uncharacterized protein (DUF433 family)
LSGELILFACSSCEAARLAYNPGALRVMLSRPMRENQALIISDPNIMMGKPVIAGTRITVELILEKLAAGETLQEILDAHPRLTQEGIRAALAFAARSLRADVVYPVEPVTP